MSSALNVRGSFIRPTVEYALVVWNGCSMHDTDKLERDQLCTARIVTGLPICCLRESATFRNRAGNVTN